MPNTPKRLCVFQKYDPPIYFVTFNTYRRQKFLVKASVHDAFVQFAREGEVRRVSVGRYVLMPDHIHLFVGGGIEFVLSQWMRLLKRHLSKSIEAKQPHWQAGFFDHLIRHSESYGAKWEYVSQNPVRAGLVVVAGDWPWQGELASLEAR
jgi:putative transposase